MIPLDAAAIAALTGGTLSGLQPEVMVSGPVVVDSRLASTGSAFVCLVGEHADGHQYVSDAI